MDQADFQTHVVEKLAELSTQMKTLVGNGHPGRIGILEERCNSIEKKVWTFSGLATAAALVIHAIMARFRL